jgi:hypothetical protein
MTMLAASRAVTAQAPLVQVVTLTQPELPSGKQVSAIYLPPGAMVTGGGLIVTTAFNSATTDVLDVGYTSNPDAYVNGGADNGSTVGIKAIVPNGVVHTSGTWIVVENNPTGTEGTAGVAKLVVEYVVLDRVSEVVGRQTPPADV